MTHDSAGRHITASDPVLHALLRHRQLPGKGNLAAQALNFTHHELVGGHFNRRGRFHINFVDR